MFASILIDIKNREVNRLFDYIIPERFTPYVKRGMRVVAPFGGQMRMGYIIAIKESSKLATKELVEVLDVIPTINEETFSLIDEIYSQTHDLYSAIFDAVVPSELNLDYQKEIILLDKTRITDEYRTKFNREGIWRLPKSNHEYDYDLRKMYQEQIIDIKQIWKQKVTEKFETVYFLEEHHQYKRIKQYPIVDDLKKNTAYTRQELLDLGLSISSIQTLVRNDVLRIDTKHIEREIKHIFELKDKKITLTDEQLYAKNAVLNKMTQFQVFLLKGITGSGKTEVYLEVMADVLKRNKQVLILVPEITLIAPMAQRLKSRFNDVAIYHSGLSNGERFDQYQLIQSGSAKIVLGTRSAVFVPLNELGLIILDESHDSSYQQHEHVIYNAVDVAIERAKMHKIPIVLGTATPKITTYYKAINKEYELLELKHRPFDVKEPEIELIDMREELKQNNTSIFSHKLYDAIIDRLNKNEQIMILFNRKGYAPFVMCRQCGHVPVCPTCGIALSYYEKERKLKCHYCGHQEDYHDTCDICHHQTMKPVGIGIEYVEKVLKKTFPDARILRMDANVTKTKGSHELLWHAFKSENADILLGTQMIAKGFDFPKVTLVGVLMADLLLHTPSYDASEQTYMLLSQIAGRSGRFLPGKVMIQTYDLEHYAIKCVTKSYEDFYKEALYERRISGYEPFMHSAQVRFEGKSYLKTYQTAYKIKKELEFKGYQILGPTQAYIKKYHDMYRFLMTLKSSNYSTDVLDIIDKYSHGDIHIKYYPYIELM